MSQNNALINYRYGNSNAEIIDLKNINTQKSKQADDVLSKLFRLVGDAAGVKAVKDSTKKDVKYVVNMTDEMKKSIADGTLKLDANKNGELFAQLRENGKYGKKLSISKEAATVGLDYLDVCQALQTKALEQELDKISDVLEEIGADVLEVIQGQQNDRLALLYSGVDLYLEAHNIQDSYFRKMLLSQSVKSISDGGSQVLESARTDINYLVEGKYKSQKKRQDVIDEKMANINRCFKVINDSYKIRAGIYYEIGELPAMLTVLDEYGQFLSNDVVPNASLLMELDKSDRLLVEGKWESRASCLLSMSNIKAQLQSNSTYYLSMGVNANG